MTSAIHGGVHNVSRRMVGVGCVGIISSIYELGGMDHASGLRPQDLVLQCDKIQRSAVSALLTARNVAPSRH